MKRLLISTALVAATSGAVMAQGADGMFRTEADPNAIHASDFIGMRVYRAETDTDAVDGLQDDWDDIGEIHDIVLTRDGQIDSVLVDIGGFLGIGENRVAVDMGSVRFVSDDATAEDETDFFLVLNAPVAALEEAPAYTGGMGDAMMDADTAMEETGAAVEGAMEETGAAVEGAMEETGEAMEGAMDAVETEVDGAMDAAEGEQPATVATETDAEVTTDLQDGAEPVDPAGGPLSYGAGLIEREGYATAPLEELTSENLTGAPAYDSTDDHIGEVSEIILSDSGEVSSVIVDVGGFLGIGEKPVQLELSQIDILRTEGGGDIRVYISMTEEELKAMPDYEG
ncbi:MULTISPECIES: PRC-barrel domain-containing protein [Marinovum]|jgi:sporulation protein YlmC with PRC-barrel domain|uniref:PRC-barrel domain-containing protein n=1 Tax=Marinovum TaxID=367771 RepID=UPI00237A2A06|nr:PRC-barrel domain-containing protein [Marinovum sp. PR37]MDD9743718.1 PRC-barrel domain-containing protein [Marinovum sp. PR37]